MLDPMTRNVMVMMEENAGDVVLKYTVRYMMYSSYGIHSTFPGARLLRSVPYRPIKCV